MPRRTTFTVDAESVQGIAGAEVTFTALKVRELREYRETTMTDAELLALKVASWSGFVDDAGKALPSPEDDPDVLCELYIHEQAALLRLLFQGPFGADVKN